MCRIPFLLLLLPIQEPRFKMKFCHICTFTYFTLVKVSMMNRKVSSLFIFQLTSCSFSSQVQCRHAMVFFLSLLLSFFFLSFFLPSSLLVLSMAILDQWLVSISLQLQKVFSGQNEFDKIIEEKGIQGFFLRCICTLNQAWRN